MEAIFIYLLKSSTILAVFYLCYHLLAQKETFFNSNRWFLLSGLFTSILLPLFFIKKVIYIEKDPVVLNLSPIDTTPLNAIQSVTIETFNWLEFLPFAYLLIGLFFILKIMINLLSLYKLLRQKEVIVNKPFALVDINENINPFSFFKYIVYNSTLYSKIELDNILQHEKVHSREKHSIDVLIAKVFCAIFWFNPFVWLYKKAILQNLEYIADTKAIQNIEDKKAYQMTLLRVVTDQNCLSITNSFYQSLIKKRIVMLNKNQSKQKNVWKYALVVPALVAFVIFFQVEVIAKEKESRKNTITSILKQEDPIVITKNMSDLKLKKIAQDIKTNHNIDLKFKGIKRNKRAEITAIQAFWNDHKGTKGNHFVDSDQAIEPFSFLIRTNSEGNATIDFASGYENNDAEYSYHHNNDENNDSAEASDIPTPPTPPLAPLAPIAPNIKNMPTPPTPPNFPAVPNIKTPTDPNDTKAWKKYEESMEKFGQEWENSPEIKKYEADMEAYGKQMEKFEPDMSAFEKEMEKFEAKMDKFNDEMEAYQEAMQDRNQDNQEAKREAIQARREALKAKKEAIEAKREAEREAKQRNN
jgi:hypothetical protein